MDHRVSGWGAQDTQITGYAFSVSLSKSSLHLFITPQGLNKSPPKIYVHLEPQTWFGGRVDADVIS